MDRRTTPAWRRGLGGGGPVLGLRCQDGGIFHQRHGNSPAGAGRCLRVAGVAGSPPRARGHRAGRGAVDAARRVYLCRCLGGRRVADPRRHALEVQGLVDHGGGGGRDLRALVYLGMELLRLAGAQHHCRQGWHAGYGRDDAAGGALPVELFLRPLRHARRLPAALFLPGQLARLAAGVRCG